MDASWLAAASPVMALGIDVVAQVGWFRVTGRRELLKSVFAGFAAGLGATCAVWLLVWRISGHLDAAWLIASLVSYAALGYGYFHFVNLGETARRVRLLWDLREAGGELSQDELLARYNASAMVGARVERLLKNKQIVLRDGRYFIARPTMRTIAYLMQAWKSIVLGGAARS